MKLLLLLGFELLFNGCLKGLFVVRLSRNKASSRGFQFISNRLRKVLVVTGLLISLKAQRIQ
jgi:hypothetical protein